MKQNRYSSANAGWFAGYAIHQNLLEKNETASQTMPGYLFFAFKNNHQFIRILKKNMGKKRILHLGKLHFIFFLRHQIFATPRDFSKQNWLNSYFFFDGLILHKQDT